jgi:hypothetical protein
MTREDFSSRVEKRIDIIRQSLLRKHKEYATDDNVFRNFEEAAEGISLHSSPEEVLWSYMTKHLVSLKDIVIEGGAKPQVVSEKIGDVINYLILLEAMLNKNDDRECKLKEAYEKHKLYNTKTSADRLSMWTSDYTKNTDMLGLVKMAANNGSDRDIDKLKYNRYPGEERGY